MSFNIVRTPVPVYVHREQDAISWLRFFQDEGLSQGLGVDTETTGLDTIRDRIRFFSLAVDTARICAPVRLLDVFVPLLEDDRVEKHLTNAKYDQHLLANHGVSLYGRIIDTVDMDFLIDENRQGGHGLKQCAKDYLGLRMTPFKQVFGNAGSGDNEVRTLCEIHDLLELHDYEGEVARAQEWARDILLRLQKVDGEPALLKAVQRLHLSLRADKCTLTARQVLALAEAFDLVEVQAGVNRHISEFMVLLGIGDGVAPKHRKDFKHLTEHPELLREVTRAVYGNLLTQTGIPENPVEALRESVTDYASLDAWATHMLVPVFRDLLANDDMLMITEGVREGTEEPRVLLEHFEEKRVPFLQILWNLERRGMRIDLENIGGLATELQTQVDKIERDIVVETRDLDFNPGSPPQLRARLYEQDKHGNWFDPFGATPKKFTKGGAGGIKLPATDKEVLEDFAGKGHTLCRLILEHRKYRKLHDDYAEGLQAHVDRRGRIHTSLNIGGARTWRLSCVDGATKLDTTAGTFCIENLDLQKNPDAAVVTHELRQQRILACFPKGEEEMFEVTLVTGEVIVCTMAHRFLTPDGWRRLDELKEGDKVLRVVPDGHSP